MAGLAALLLMSCNRTQSAPEEVQAPAGTIAPVFDVAPIEPPPVPPAADAGVPKPHGKR
jgi:hypothetical protein